MCLPRGGRRTRGTHMRVPLQPTTTGGAQAQPVLVRTLPRGGRWCTDPGGRKHPAPVGGDGIQPTVVLAALAGSGAVGWPWPNRPSPRRGRQRQPTRVSAAPYGGWTFCGAMIPRLRPPCGGHHRGLYSVAPYGGWAETGVGRRPGRSCQCGRAAAGATGAKWGQGAWESVGASGRGSAGSAGGRTYKTSKTNGLRRRFCPRSARRGLGLREWPDPAPRWARGLL